MKVKWREITNDCRASRMDHMRVNWMQTSLEEICRGRKVAMMMMTIVM